MTIKIKELLSAILLFLLLCTGAYQAYYSYTNYGWATYTVINTESLFEDIMSFAAILLVAYTLISLAYKVGTTELYRKIVTKGIVLDYDGEAVNILKDDIRIRIPKETLENLLGVKKDGGC